MKTKASVFVCTSVDGFIARKDGTLDWLDKANELVPKGEDCGFRAFLASVDTMIMGRKTFDQVLTFGEWIYGVLPVIVLSNGHQEIPAHLKKTVLTSSESPTLLCNRLNKAGIQHLYVDGGFTIQQFLKAGLIDEITITVAPVVLGEGKPLFEHLGEDLALTHLGTKSFNFGFVQLSYAVKNPVAI